jgi:hypothetical protein
VPAALGDAAAPGPAVAGAEDVEGHGAARRPADALAEVRQRRGPGDRSGDRAVRAPRGRPVCRRQQGKTELCLGAQVHRALAFPGQNIVYAAQTRNDARKRWEDEFWEKIAGSTLAKYARIRKSNGNEAILWPGKRSRMGITANTEKAGHGPPLDLGFIDEAFAHGDDRLEQAFSPAMLTRAMAQLWWASAGGTTSSVWLNKKRKAGRALIEALWAALAEDPRAPSDVRVLRVVRAGGHAAR